MRRLLVDGCTVHATARALDDSERTEGKLKVLRDLQKEYGEERLVLFQANLLEEGSFEEAMQGSTATVHAASPVVQYPDDPEEELLKPAVLGTRNVLQSALKRAQQLRKESPSSSYRVCVLSSIAAVQQETNGHVNTEEDWFSPDISYPYAMSKRLAEEEAWKIALSPEAAQAGVELVCINPGVVVGEILSPRLGSSAKFVLDVFIGTFAKCPPMKLACVSMDDVAEACSRGTLSYSVDLPREWKGIDTSTGLENRELREIAKNNRFILVSESLWVREIGDTLAEKFPAYPVSQGEAPYWVISLLATVKPKDKVMQYIARLCKTVQEFSGEAAVKAGLLQDAAGYRDLDAAFEETCESFVRYGLARKPEEKQSSPTRWTWVALAALLPLVAVGYAYQHHYGGH